MCLPAPNLQAYWNNPVSPNQHARANKVHPLLVVSVWTKQYSEIKPTIVPPEALEKTNPGIHSHSNDSAHNQNADNVACRDHMRSADGIVDMRYLANWWTTGRNLIQWDARLNQSHNLGDLCRTCHVDDSRQMAEWWRETGLGGDNFRQRDQVGIYRQTAGWGQMNQSV